MSHAARSTALAMLVVASLLLSVLVVGVVPAAAVPPTSSATSGITVSADGGGTLAGGTRTVSVSAANPSGADLFNATAVAVLPVGVTYVPGSSPIEYGEPTIQTWIPDPNDPDPANPATAQVLVWQNIADLPVGSDFALTFGVTGDPARYPAGSVFDVGVGVYASLDERRVPDVQVPASGPPVIVDADEGGTADATVAIVAVTLAKAETANPESEVYRGPSNLARFELTVRAAPEAGTRAVVVVDDVPAQFAVTGCTGLPCTRQILTVAGKVVTRITWNLGDIAAGSSTVLAYDAYVPDNEITMPSGAPTGPSTRPGPTGYGVVNTATLTGTYEGSVASGSSQTVSITETATVRVLDLGIVKTSDSGVFTGGETKGYTLAVRSSQYITSRGITVTDTLPDGMCPVLPPGVARTGDPWPAECAAAEAGTGTVTGATMTSVDFDATTGEFTVQFAVADLAADQDATIRYAAYMRMNFQDGTPTSVGATFTNRASVAGTTDGASGPVATENDSSSTVGTGAVTLVKSIWENAARTPITGVSGAGATCRNGTYTNPTVNPAYQLGDLVCFRIEASFPAGVATRWAVLSDYLPAGMSLVAWEAGPGNTTTIAPVGTAPTTATRFALGDVGADGVRFVAPGAKLTIDLLAHIDTVPTTTPRVTGNLARLVYSDVDGRRVNVRAEADLTISPAPPLTLAKKVNGVDALSPVREGQALAFTIDVTHAGTVAGGNGDPVDRIEVWDVLPAGFTCSDITTASPAIDPATACVSNPDGTTRVRWQIDLTGSPLQRGATISISYTLVVPSPLSISSTHTNTAAVVRYTPVSTDGITPVGDRPAFYPTNPVGGYPAVTKNAPEASDTATIGLGDASVAKAVVSTSVTAPNNSFLTQATIGEDVVWTYTATIPARTSVFNGILSDGLPVGSRLVAGATAPSATSSAGVSIGTGCTQDATAFRLCTDAASAQFGELLFPVTWTNTSNSPATFTVTLPTRVADVGANAHLSTISNTATLTSTPTAAAGTPVTRATGAAQITVVVPTPALSKAVSTTGTSGPWSTSTIAVPGGQTVYYRLQVTNTGTNPPSLYDTTIVDCIDSRLSAFANLTSPSVATVSAGVPGDVINGCAFGRTKYTWTLANPVGTSAVSILYSAQMPSPIPAGLNFQNDATVTGSTIAGTVTGERILTATASRTITSSIPTVTKQRTTPATGSVVPGESVSWRVTVTIPVGVNLYDARVLDTLGAPLGTAAASTFTVSCGTGWTTPCPTATRLPAPSGSPQVLGVFFGDIAADAAPRILYVDITSTVPVSTAATVTSATNQARVSWNTVDAGGPPPTATAGTSTTGTVSATVDIRHPAVSVGKSVSDASSPKAQGQIFTYTVTAQAVQNASPNGKTAYNVQLVDAVPAGVIPVVSPVDGTPVGDGGTVSSGGVWNQTARTITWTIPSLTPGAAATSLTYSAKLAPAAALTGAALVNTVVPTSWQSLPANGKTYTSTTGASASVTPAFPRIDATKTQQTANPVYIGQDVTYAMTLTNGGTAAAVSLSAVDTLPAGWSYVAGSAQLGGVALADPTIAGQVLTWAGLGPLAPTQSLTITYRAVASASVAVGSSVAHTNTVRAALVTDATGGTSYDGGAGSYIGTSGSATARIDQADLAVRKTPGTFTAGSTGSFTIVVTNNGGDPAVGLQLSDPISLPTGVTLTGATTTGGGATCTVASGTVTCTRATLAASATWTITLAYAVAADVVTGTQVVNTATVSARTEDRTPGNNTDTATATVTTSADLEVVKRVVTPATGAVVAGTGIEWSITLTNRGPSLSRGSAGSPIVLTDTLPANVTGLALTGTVPAGCTLTGRELRCEIARDLAVGEAVVVTVAGTVPSSTPAAVGAIVNTARVTPVTTDPVPGNNASTTTTDVAVAESLTIQKTIVDPAPPAEVVPGDPITYTLQVSNGGPSDARGVYIDDTMPAALAFDTIVAPAGGWSAATTATGVRFTYSGVVAAGTSAPLLTNRVTLDPAFTGTADELENTASVSSAWRADQDTDSATPGTPSPEADLALSKTVRPSSGAVGDPVVAGQTVVYTLSVDNLGPSDSGAVTVRDTLPVGMSVVGPLPAACTAAGAVITCVLPGGLDVTEAPWTFSVTARVDASFTGTSLVNSARVTSTTFDPNPTNDTATATVNVVQRATLTVTKTPAPATVTAGENTVWTIVVANAGPSDAQNVTLTDAIDPRLAFVSATSPTSGVTCTAAATLSCAIGTIPAGGEVRVLLTTTVRSLVPAGSTIPNAATAQSTTIDPATGQPATATGTNQIAVTARSELTIDKTTTTPTVRAGETATFRIAVGNTGPSDAAANVVVTDTLPAGLTFVSASTIGGPAQWSCAPSGQTVTCTLTAGGTPATLVASSSAPVLEIIAAVAAGTPAGTLTNTATATSPSEPTPPTDTAEITVVTFADLGITKANVGTPTAGEEFTWTIAVTNHGPSDSVATVAAPIVVTDQLPAGVRYVSALGTGATCSVAESAGVETVTCAIAATLAPAGTVTIALRVAVDEAVSGTLTNTAVVTPSLTPEPPGAVWPNTATVTTPPVIEVADLTIAKTVTTPPADIVAGRSISWAVTVTNLGPSNSDASAAQPIRVTDTLPTGTTFVSAAGTGWTCAAGATTPAGRATVDCTRTTALATGAAPAITVTALVDPAVQGSIRNDVLVTPGLTPEPAGGAGNNTAFAVATVAESADLLLTKAVTTAITAGGSGAYTLTVTNLGPSSARDVAIVDTLPAGLTFASASGTDWTCAPDATDPSRVDCAYTGILAPTGSLSLVLTVSAAETLQGDIVNTAVVSASTPDPDLSNNTGTATGTVVETADLSIVKSVVGSPAVGGTFSYTLDVRNAGPSTARGVLVTDTLPAGLELVSASAAGAWTCATDASAGSVACTLPALARGATAPLITIEVRVLPAAYPEVSNTAVVSATTPEDPGTQADNTSTVVTPIPAVSSLTITKERLDELVTGSPARYVITVTNGGPTPDPGPITVSDPMPPGLIARGATLEGAGGSCAVTAAAMTCEIAGLAIGQVATITLTVDVSADARGTIDNVVTAQSVAAGAAVQADALGVVRVVALPSTGGTLAWAVPIGGILLILAGLVIVLARRRRRA